ncbi:MAG TPA: FAD:protein FMN transferase [Thermoanaerobaculia bacterium]
MKQLLAAVLALTATVAHAEVSRARFLMGTVCEITAADEASIEQAFAEAKRVEAMLSTWTDDSELARLNAGDCHASTDLAEVLTSALHWSRRTNGAFNPLVKPLIDAWKTRDDGALPDPRTLERALARTAVKNVTVSDDCFELRNGAVFEEGGFGKGYALERMLAYLGGPRALIDFGGQLVVRGEQIVTIADPADRDRPAVELLLTDTSLSTSSGSEKTFEAGGRRFSHIFDPRTGEALPPRGSVSVIHSEAMTADILSTALYVMGSDQALRWANENGVAAIIIDTENHLRLSAPARRLARNLKVLDPRFVLKD